MAKNRNNNQQSSTSSSIADSTLPVLETGAVATEETSNENDRVENNPSSDPIDVAAEEGPIDPPATPTDATPTTETITDTAPAAPAPSRPPMVEATVIVPDSNSSPLPIEAPTPDPVLAPVPVHNPLDPVSTTKVVVGDAPATGMAKQIIDEVSAKVGNTAKFNLQTLADYMENMAPRKVMAANDGARHQVALYRALTNIINNTTDDFPAAFAAVLKLMDENRDGVFHESHVFRFMDVIALPEADRKAFQRLLNLLKLLAPTKGRKLAMGQVDFERSLEHGITEAGRQRVAAFFNR